ncbi:MAG: hypothetical protein NVS4B7_14950 [Ktedonobacteraceae bacterium]
METTISLEFISDTKEHLKALEHQLKHIHGVQVELLEPRDSTAPALVGIGINPSADQAAQEVAQILYSLLREAQSTQGQKKISLVTAEGDRVDIANLSVEDIHRIIVAAQEGE